MSDVSKTTDLIAEVRETHERQDRREGEPPMCLACSPADWPCDAVRAANALEAATRVPVQGEPGQGLRRVISEALRTTHSWSESTQAVFDAVSEWMAVQGEPSDDREVLAELIAELRKAQDAAGSIPHGTMDHETQWLPFANLYNAADALLDALEAAARVPVQGEPNDEPCLGCGSAAEDGHDDCTIKVRTFRATVPDAATEQAKQELAACLDLRAYWRDQTVKARAERDAALARIAEAAELHRPVKMIDGWGKSMSRPDDFLICEHCTDPDNWWVAHPCATRIELGLDEGESDD